MRMASVFSVGAALSGGEASAASPSISGANFDDTGNPLAYTVNPVTRTVTFGAPELPAVTSGTVAPVLFYFGNTGTSATGETANQGAVAFDTTGLCSYVSGPSATGYETFTYTPAPGFYGTDTFTYHMKNGNAVSSAYTVTLLVGNPLAVVNGLQNFSFTPIVAPTALSNFIASGSGNDTANYCYKLTRVPTHGILGVVASSNITTALAVNATITTASVNAVTFGYKPNDKYYGPDSFEYTITDTGDSSALISGQFNINVQAQGIHTFPGQFLTVEGQISGSNTLVVDGGGTLTLNNRRALPNEGVNDFSGGTYVNNSTLLVATDDQLPGLSLVRLSGAFIGSSVTGTVITNAISLG